MGFPLVILIEVILAVIASQWDESGMIMTALIIGWIIPTVIAWPIVARINYRAAQRPTKMLSGDELRRFKIIRTLIIVGIAVLLLAVLIPGITP